MRILGRSFERGTTLAGLFRPINCMWIYGGAVSTWLVMPELISTTALRHGTMASRGLTFITLSQWIITTRWDGPAGFYGSTGRKLRDGYLSRPTVRFRTVLKESMTVIGIWA